MTEDQILYIAFGIGGVAVGLAYLLWAYMFTHGPGTK